MNKLIWANLAAAAAALSAGAAVVATRYLAGEAEPAELALYRYVVGVICFAPALPFIWPKQSLPMVEVVKIAALGVVFFALFPWTFNASLNYVPAARGAVDLATIPIQTLIVAVLFGRERLTIGKIVSVGLAFAGIALVFGPAAVAGGDADYLLGDGLMLAGGLCAAIYSVFARNTLSRHGPLFVTALAMVFGAVALLPIAALESGFLSMPKYRPEVWLTILFLGTFAGALQFSLFTWALRWLPPTRTVIYLTLNPISAVILSLLLIGERIDATLVAGLALVLTGVFAANRPAAEKPLKKKDAAPAASRHRVAD